MKLYHDTRLILDVQVDDDSYSYEAISSIGELVLKFKHPESLRLPNGTHTEFLGEEYILMSQEDVQIVNSQTREYSLTMKTLAGVLPLYRVRNPTDGSLKFPLIAKPQTHLELIVQNLNERGWKWSVGAAPDTGEVSLEYNHIDCYAALSQLADACHTEFYISQGVLSLGKLELHRDDPIELSYGKGKGLRGGIQISAPAEEAPLSRVYIQGSERNIDPAKYGNRTLLFPRDYPVEYLGKRYVTSKDGRYVARVGGGTFLMEDSIDLEGIYPSRVGQVTEVETEGRAENPLYNFIDSTIPQELNFTDYLLPETPLLVKFEEGMLVGEELEVRYVHADRKFEIVQKELNGEIIPNPNFAPQVGQRYAVFNCALPAYYIEDAEHRALQEALEYLNERKEQRIIYTAPVDSIFAKKHWNTIGHRLKLGNYVSLQLPNNSQVSVRIVGVKHAVNNPYAPEIELSNAPVSSAGYYRATRQVKRQEVSIAQQGTKLKQLAARTARDVLETRKIIEQLKFDEFTETITPQTLQTLQTIVGSRLLQFDFVSSPDSSTEVPFAYQLNRGGTELVVPTQYLRRQKAGREITAEPTYEVYTVIGTTWSYKDTDPKKLYLYIEIEGENARFSVGKEERAVTENNLLVALLTGDPDARQVTTLYGFTEILPGQLQTDLIRSKNGKTYWDLRTGRLVIGDPKGDTCLAYIDGTLYLKGASVNVGTHTSTIEEAIANTETKIDNLRIGGRNLIRGADWTRINRLDIRHWPRGSLQVYHDDIYPYVVQGYEWGLYCTNRPLEIGKTYTISLMCKIHRADSSNERPRIRFSDYRENENASFPVSDKWERYSLTFVAGNKSKDGFYLLAYNDGRGSTLRFAEIQLEEGNVATAFSPAPEDVQEEVEAGLTNVKTLVQALEKAQENKVNTADIRYLVDSLREGKTSTHGGLLLTNSIVLSEPVTGRVTAIISGSDAEGAAAIRLGITPDGKGETTLFGNDGTARIGDLYFGGEYIEFQSRGSSNIQNYLQIGGEARSESDMVGASTETKSYRPSGKTVYSSGTYTLDSFKTESGNVEVCYSARIDLQAEATACPDLLPPGEREPGGQGEQPPKQYSNIHWQGERSSAECILRLVQWRDGIMAKQVETERFKVEAYAPGGWFDPRVTPPMEKILDIRNGHWGRVLAIPAEEVQKGDRFELQMVAYLDGGSPRASASDIATTRIYDTSKPEVRITRDATSFFFGRSKYLILNPLEPYLRDYMAKMVGNFLLQGNIRVRGAIQGDRFDMPGGPICGAVFHFKGEEQRGFGSAKNRSGYTTGYAYYSYSSKSYTVYHTIGHTKYMPLVTPWSNNRNVTIDEINAWSFIVKFYSDREQGVSSFGYVAFQTE